MKTKPENIGEEKKKSGVKKTGPKKPETKKIAKEKPETKKPDVRKAVPEPDVRKAVPEPDVKELEAKSDLESDVKKIDVKKIELKKIKAKELEVDEIEIEDTEVKRDFFGWNPKTTLGLKVKSGDIKNVDDLMGYSTPIREVEIIDAILPDLDEEIIDVGRVQRTTDSGRRMRFRVVATVGNKNGYVGVGKAKGKEAGPTIRKAIERAKLNIKSIKRGCGSWECGCKGRHSVPFKVIGKCGSVRVSLSPAPKGTGLASGEIARKILTLAGVSDVWVHTEGYTRTSINFAFAVFNALENTNKIKIREKDIDTLGVVSGAV